MRIGSHRRHASPGVHRLPRRLTALRKLVAWLERAGQTRLFLIDNDSAYPPLLDYLASSPHTVLKLATNAGHTAPWTEEIVSDLREPFVVTDPDVVPDESCPLDVVDRLHAALERHPDVAGRAAIDWSRGSD